MRYLFLCLFITGCDVANRVQASGDVMNSKATYKKCLTDTPDNCAAQKAMYEADIKAMDSLSRSRGSDNTTVINNNR